MSLTIAQKSNAAGFPKPAEIIEITGAHELEAQDRAVLNLLYQYAHDSGRLGEVGAEWEVPITTLRPSKHNGTGRIRDSLARIISIQVKVGYCDDKTGRDRVLLTHLFESFDLAADEAAGDPVRFRLPISLASVLAKSNRWGRIKAKTVCAMSSRYAIALYELIQLRAGMDRCVEVFPVARFREMMGVPPGTYHDGTNFVRKVIEPAVLEVNALSDLGVTIEVRRRSPRASIEAVAVTWWKKGGDQFRETIRERERPKLGRRARLKAQVEASASTRLTG